MLNFQKKPPKNPGFTLDKVKMMQSKAPVDHRRSLHLLFLLGIAVVSGVLLWSFMSKLRDEGGAPYAAHLQDELSLPPMVKPSIAELPALPDADAIAEFKKSTGEQLQNGTIPLWIDQPDASTLAWIRARLDSDTQTPTVPQRVEARDLIQRHIKVGSMIVLTGLLEDSQPASIANSDYGYQHLLLALPNEQYVQVLAPESSRELLIGEQVQIIGRYLGFSNLPPSDNDPIPPTPPAAPDQASAPNENTTPVDPAKSMLPKKTQAAPQPKVISVPYIAARLAAHPEKTIELHNPYQMTGNWRMPDDIYANIDDDLLVVETRPYYYTLGQVLLDRTNPGFFEGIPSVNEKGSQIHKNPSEFRGQPFKITGRVFHAWEDEGVAFDKPFGIDRVVRVIMWSEDWGDWDVYEGEKIVTKRKLILRTFEAAMITHQPLPKTNDLITMSGRFLRIRAMEVENDPMRDKAHGIRRHSNRSHTFLFVTGDYEIVPPAPTYDYTPLIILVLIIAIIMSVVVIITARKDGQKAERVQDSVRRLRESRRALEQKKTTAVATGPATESATESANSEEPKGEIPSPTPTEEEKKNPSPE